MNDGNNYVSFLKEKFMTIIWEKYIHFSFNKWSISTCMELPEENKAVHLFYTTKFKYFSQIK